MARTRQKRKAKRREEQLKATRRDATAKQQPANPAEQAAIQTAEALEAGDELEEIARGEETVAEAPPAAPAKEDRERDGAAARKERQRKEPRRERKPAPERRKEGRQRGRVMAFFVQVWAELRRVQWPDRNQVTQATSVVIVFCFLAGAFLALFDFIFGELITSIL
jgi:preprotein translocase SecE subunit